MFSLGFDMLKKIGGLFWFITDQGKKRLEGRGGEGRGGGGVLRGKCSEKP